MLEYRPNSDIPAQVRFNMIWTNRFYSNVVVFQIEVLCELTLYVHWYWKWFEQMICVIYRAPIIHRTLITCSNLSIRFSTYYCGRAVNDYIVWICWSMVYMLSLTGEFYLLDKLECTYINSCMGQWHSCCHILSGLWQIRKEVAWRSTWTVQIRCSREQLGQYFVRLEQGMWWSYPNCSQEWIQRLLYHFWWDLGALC